MFASTWPVYLAVEEGRERERRRERERELELTSVRFVPLIPNPNTLRNTKRITSETVLLVDLAVRGRLLRIVSSERRAEGGEGEEEEEEGRSPFDMIWFSKQGRFRCFPAGCFYMEG